MSRKPQILNLHPQDSPVPTGQEARQGTLYERTGGRRWMALFFLLALVAAIAAITFVFGGSAAPPVWG